MAQLQRGNAYSFTTVLAFRWFYGLAEFVPALRLALLSDRMS